jgi:hypothetical protein
MTIRDDICSADRPEYCHITLTTGISMLGKISVGVRRIVTGPMMRSNIDRTTKV